MLVGARDERTFSGEEFGAQVVGSWNLAHAGRRRRPTNAADRIGYRALISPPASASDAAIVVLSLENGQRTWFVM
jgi:hypothetical protein